MSVRTARRLLWAALVLMLPAPFFLAETGLVPPARIFMLALLTLGVIFTEGAQGVAGICAIFLLAQALAYFAALWMVAALFTRLIGSLAPRATTAVMLLLLIVGVTIASRSAVYRDPFRAHSLYVNLLHVYE